MQDFQKPFEQAFRNDVSEKSVISAIALQDSTQAAFMSERTPCKVHQHQEPETHGYVDSKKAGQQHDECQQVQHDCDRFPPLSLSSSLCAMEHAFGDGDHTHTHTPSSLPVLMRY